MKSTLLPIVFATGLGVSALVIKRDVCFTMNTQLGYIATSSEGQNAIGTAANGPTQYCISANTLSVQSGPECLVDSSANQQFSCSDFDGIVSKSNFSIADNNDLLYNGCPNFFACKNNVAGSSYSVFADSASNTRNCTSLNIQLAGFSGTGLGGSTTGSSVLPPATGTATSLPLSSSSVTVTPFIPATTPTVGKTVVTSSKIANAASSTISGVTCPTDLSKGAIAPNLFVHVRPSDVDYTSGSSPNVSVTPTDSSVLAFDVPVSYTDTCALLFMFPYSSELNASDKLNPYEFSGAEEEEGEKGGLVFSLLDGEVHNTTTYSSKPAVKSSYGTTEIIPGNSYKITEFECQWGESAYQIDSAGQVSLVYDQDVDDSPMGLYVVHCSGSSA